jgi:hypothetical protein
MTAQQRFVAADAIRAEVRRFADDVLAEAIGLSLGKVMRKSEARCAALEKQINELRSAMEKLRDDAARPVPP